MTRPAVRRLARVAGFLLTLTAAASQGRSTAIVGATSIDGSGAPPVEDATVVVRDERIVAAGPRADVTTPEDATIFDASGRFLIPGLVDLHNHYGGGREGLERLFALQLEFGVTTARSLGADGPENLAVIADAKAGTIPAPRLYTAGAGFSHPLGMPPGDVIQRPATEEEARQMVRDLAAADVDLIKKRASLRCRRSGPARRPAPGCSRATRRASGRSRRTWRPTSCSFPAIRAGTSGTRVASSASCRRVDGWERNREGVAVQ